MVWVIISREGGGKTHTVTPFKLSIQQQFLTWFPTGLTKIDPKTYGQGPTPPPPPSDNVRRISAFKRKVLPYPGTNAIVSCPVEPTESSVHGQLTQHNPKDFTSPNRLGLFATLIAPQNPHLTFHNLKTILIQTSTLKILIQLWGNSLKNYCNSEVILEIVIVTMSKLILCSVQ